MGLSLWQFLSLPVYQQQGHLLHLSWQASFNIFSKPLNFQDAELSPRTLGQEHAHTTERRAAKNDNTECRVYSSRRRLLTPHLILSLWTPRQGGPAGYDRGCIYKSEANTECPAAHQRPAPGCIHRDVVAPWYHSLNVRADLHHQPALSRHPARQGGCSENSKELPLFIFSVFQPEMATHPAGSLQAVTSLSIDSQSNALCVNQISHLALLLHDSISRENEVVWHSWVH